jgi:hypothetical protein
MGSGCEECKNRGQVQHYRCPKSQSSTAASEILRLAYAVDAGFLPTGGGYGDQPSRIMRLIEIALHERAEIERANAEKAGKS